jgi:hypothetical protein
MMPQQNKYNINLKLIAISLIAVFLSFFFHESAHYITGKLLGYDMWMNLNAVGLVEGQTYDKEWHEQLVSISGPIFTIIQAIVFFYIIKKTKNLSWYPFLFITALIRLFATVISATKMANDEARVSEWLGIGKMTLPIIVSFFLIGLVIKTTLDNKINWKVNATIYAIMSIGITTIIFLN